MNKVFLLLSALLIIAANAFTQFQDPFSFTTEVEGDTLSVSFSVPDKLYLYEDKVIVKAGESELIPLSRPQSVEKRDPESGEPIKVYDSSFTLKYQIQPPMPESITVEYSGCDDRQCYLPQTREIILGPGKNTAPEIKAPSSLSVSDDDFIITGRVAGYLSAEDFLGFLDNSEAGSVMSRNRLMQIFEKNGAVPLLLLIILFGLGLNLTPCVLPMIPVNIAIIGAGVQAGSRLRGFALGATYGLGISIAYGLLGVLFVLTGTRFGTLNASPVFNIGMGIIFLTLSLAMFGIFNLDFTNFQGKIGSGGRKGSFPTAFFLGAIAALLAGACVAPVVISTLVLALDIYNKGNPAGLFLPFLLGLGMALPWPFAGAGLSFLPKAGAWMEKVKYGFGIVIIAAALYYIGLGTKLAMDRSESSQEEVAETVGAKKGWYSSLEAGMQKAREENKPVFVDFWASWCKNCLKMEKTTFLDEEVLRRLDSYVKVKIDASDQGKPEVKSLLDKYVQVGLPTYVILKYEK